MKEKHTTIYPITVLPDDRGFRLHSILPDGRPVRTTRLSFRLKGQETRMLDAMRRYADGLRDQVTEDTSERVTLQIV